MDYNDFTKEIIKIEAEALSRKRGLDASRVMRVFDKLAEINWLAPNFPRATALDESFTYVEPLKALTVFENEDLTRLASRVLLIDYFAERTTPFYSLEELSTLTDNFISHLSNNEEHLIKTGFPETSFERSLWMDWHLNKLYYVKIPLFHPLVRQVATECAIDLLESFIPGSSTITVNDQGNFHYNYIWSKEPLPGGETISIGEGTLIKGCDIWWNGNGPLFNDGSPVTTCSYENAALMNGLNPHDASRLEKMRKRIFDLKIAILKRLHQALTCQSSEYLREDCSYIIAGYLNAEEVDFLLKADHYFAGSAIGGEICYSPNLNALMHHNAGLSDLLEVIGHYQKEIDIGTMDETYKAIMEIPMNCPLNSYYQAVGEIWEEDLKYALYLFSKLETRENNFWDGYRKYINDLLEKGLLGCRRENTDLHKSFVQFDMFIKQFGNWKEKNDPDGIFPKINSPEDVLITQGANYEFIKKGNFWSITYEGKNTLIKNSVGLQYISKLLAHPTREFHALDLVLPSRNIGNYDSTKYYGKMSKEQLEEEAIRNIEEREDGELADAQARQEYQNKLREFEEEIQTAKDNLDYERAEILEDKKQDLLDHLKELYGISGRPRKFSSNSERARKAVSIAITRAIANIKDDLPQLAIYLNNSLQKGTFLSYNPAKEIPWNI